MSGQAAPEAEIPDKTEAELTRSALLKIERAKEHINDLNRKLGEYLAQAPFHLRIRQDQDPPRRMVYVHANPPIPETAFALIVGDAVHNLRTALDHVCYAMVGDKAPTPERVGFPFAKTAEGLSGAINTRQMQVAPKNVIDEIHALKPYPNGNHSLHAVKAMDERDKHHFVLTVAYSIQLKMSQLADLIGGEVVEGFSPDMVVSTAGGFVASVDPELATTSFDKEADFQPPFSVGFSEGEEMVGQPIISALKLMCKATEDAVIRLAAAYIR